MFGFRFARRSEKFVSLKNMGNGGTDWRCFITIFEIYHVSSEIF